MTLKPPIAPSPQPLQYNESERIAALQSYKILDTEAEKDFDDLTELASVICQSPIALITFMEADRQWFKSRKGTTETQNHRELSFCTHNMASADPVMVIDDATQDDRFKNNPLVTGEHHIAFYAGVSLVNKDGYALGSLCVLDNKAKTLSKDQVSALMIVAGYVVEKLELRRKVYELEENNQKLYESEHRFRNLVKQAPIAIAIYTGPEMVIEQANEHMLNLLGQSDAIIGLTLLEARPELAEHPYLNTIQGVFTTGIEHRGANIKAPVRHNGQVVERFFDAIYKPVKNEKYQVVAVMVVATDVTDKYLLDQRKDDFLSIASHELKTPITSLRLGLQLLDMIKEKPFSPMHGRLIEQSNKSVEKMNDLVDTLLNVKRMTDGELKLNKATFNIAQMLNDSCGHVRVDGKYNLHIEGDTALEVFADEHRIDQVVVNFVNNAIKYAPNSRDIHIIIEHTGKNVRISVKDNGPGIAKNKVPYIFERYYQADNSNPSYHGLGLGLYICSEIVSKHNGAIGVESEPGEGCTFWFTLPLQ
jgi:PAS domain S-box-containing protein